MIYSTIESFTFSVSIYIHSARRECHCHVSPREYRHQSARTPRAPTCHITTIKQRHKNFIHKELINLCSRGMKIKWQKNSTGEEISVPSDAVDPMIGQDVSNDLPVCVCRLEKSGELTK